MVDGDIEEALNRGGVQIESEDAIGPGAFNETGHQFGRDGNAGFIFAILPGIAVIGQDGGDAIGRSALEGVDHQEEFHDVGIDGAAGGLDDEDVGAADVFFDLEVNLTVGEGTHRSNTEFGVEALADFRRKGGVGVAGEYLEFVESHRAYRLRGGHCFSSVCSWRAFAQEAWYWRRDKVVAA